MTLTPNDCYGLIQWLMEQRTKRIVDLICANAETSKAEDEKRLTNEERIAKEKETWDAWAVHEPRLRQELPSAKKRTHVKTEAKGKRD
jgi:hypothetical protein